MSNTDASEISDHKDQAVIKQSQKNLSTQHKPVDTQPSLQLSISSERSEDSLDSGVYTREKFCDSMESLNSIESATNGAEKGSAMKRVASTDEVIPPLPILQYADYIRECQDIQRSIIIRNKEEGKPNLSRSSSFDEQHDEDSAVEWLQMAGLSDLIVNPSLSKPTKMVSRDSLSSMTVLLTLTRPQREAVLRRITSFNRKQMTKKSKPSITSVFPSVELSSSATPEDTMFSSSEKKIDESHDTIEPRKASSESSSMSIEPMIKQRPNSAYHSQESVTKTDGPNASGFVESDDADEVECTVQAVSTESLPSSTMPAIKPTFDITPRSSFSIPRKRASGLVNLRDSMCASLPDLNAPPPQPVSDTLESTSDQGTQATLKPSPSNSLLGSDEGLTMNASPTVKRRSATIDPDRNKKALSDVPLDFDSLSTLPPSSASRLRLQADTKEEKVSRFKRSSRKSLKTSSLFKFNASRRNIERSRRAASQQNKKSYTNYPDIKHQIMASPTSYSTVKPRSPPLNSSLFHGKNKQSPLRKLSSISFSTLRSPPKRSGSYKLKQSVASPRRSLRRSRSLKIRDKPSISLISMTESGSKNIRRFLSRAPSIETLSISSTRSDSISWKSSKEEISNEDDSFPVKRKGMSFSAEVASQDFLPDYSLVRDHLGITKISDLSPHDMKKVQSLALIELTALFDLKSIELKRRKLGKNKQKDPGVFGTSLCTLVEWDCKRGYRGDSVPCVFTEIIFFLERYGLKVEGILRKSGSAARIKALKQDIDQRYGINVSGDPPSSPLKAWTDAQTHDVAALLKQFLRDLPDPLLSCEYIHAFQSCRLILDRKEQLQALNLLIILLDPVHRNSLKFLLKFLSQVVANEQHNKMSLNNVAMIVAPNLFINTRKGSKKEQMMTQDLKLAAGTSNIVRMLIKYHKLLWTVPAFMLTQVRRMNKAEMGSKKSGNVSKDKLKVKLFQSGRKESSKNMSFVQQIAQPFDYDTPKNLIRVQAPNMKLTSIAVQVDSQLSASDVLDKYRRQCERMKQAGDQRDQISNSSYALYEFGGNIHERCLDPNANIAAILSVNPDVSWFIRRKNGR